MPPSPSTGTSDRVALSLTSEGTSLAATIPILSIETFHAYNRIPRATVVVLDGDMPNATMPVSDANTFKPGSKIAIQAGYGDATAKIFEGLVVRHGVTIPSDGETQLVVECRDATQATTVARTCANHLEMTDSDAISAILSKHGLSPTVDATSVVHEELVQFDCTDWDFVVARAECNGLLVNVDAGAVHVKAPDGSGAPVLTLTYGLDILSFQAELNSVTQLKKVEASAWDPAKQAIATKSASPSPLTGQGNLAAGPLADVLAVPSLKLQSSSALPDAELESWSKARQLKAELSRIRGKAKFQGNALVKPGKVVQLAGVGARFNGNVLVSAVHHVIADGNWTTEIEFGMDPDWFVERYPAAPLRASGANPGVNGLQIGVVKKLEGDPLSHYRVQVSLPTTRAEKDGIWARLATPRASAGSGTFFVPEVGDEVVLGYLNDDPSHPVILGSLHSSKNKAPREIEAENKLKAIVTKSMLTIEFDDDKKVLTLSTPGGNSIVLSDDAKSILLKDQNGNKVELGSSGITLDSPKDVTIKATGAVSIEATGKISVKSQQDIVAEGLNVQLNAKMGMTAKGAATAELSASGQTTVKGAMVMIN